ncbi:hypothetical protein LX36DRAFT_418242 [Colletotrichum falcatum]|nr:hypothetical protein LX36DRAFT_418242 [Colletotrichum falcatum]
MLPRCAHYVWANGLWINSNYEKSARKKQSSLTTAVVGSLISVEKRKQIDTRSGRLWGGLWGDVATPELYRVEYWARYLYRVFPTVYSTLRTCATLRGTALMVILVATPEKPWGWSVRLEGRDIM